MVINNALEDRQAFVSEPSSQGSDLLNQTKDIISDLTEPKIRVLIVDDLRLVCEGLQAIFAEDENVEIVGYALNGQDAIKQISQVQPDVVVLDLVMPVMGGIETTKLINQKYPEVKILILTSSEDDSAVLEAIIAGANGYLLKSMIISELALAIRSVHTGSSHFAEGLIDRLAKIATANLDTQVKAEINNSPSLIAINGDSPIVLAKPQTIEAIKVNEEIKVKQIQKAQNLKKSKQPKQPKQPIPEKPLYPHADWILVAAAIIVLSQIQGMGHDLGHAGLFLLMLALIARPIKSSWNGPMKFRRAVGVTALAGALSHTIYATRDFLEGSWGTISLMTTQHKIGMWAGIISLFIMAPAGITSFRFMQRKLGKNWRKIHLLTLPAMILAVLHAILIGPHYLMADGQLETASYLYSFGLIAIAILILLLRQTIPWSQLKFSNLKQLALKVKFKVF
ncbi:MAG: response regulator [Hydrococcus sp. SU_1_0]|nr:response regulator [Hydrococcus sp. SU_1_0]